MFQSGFWGLFRYLLIPFWVREIGAEMDSEFDSKVVKG